MQGLRRGAAALPFLAVAVLAWPTGAGAQGLLPGSLIANGTITGAQVADDSLTGFDLLESSLGKVPSAAKADSATRADSATTADSAAHADSATNADSAANATKLGGVAASGYVGGAMLATPFQDTITIPASGFGGLGGGSTAGGKLAFGISCSFASTPPGYKVVFGQVTGQDMTLFTQENDGAPVVVTQPSGPIQAAGQYGSSFVTGPTKFSFEGYNGLKRFSATLWGRQDVSARRCELTGTVFETR